MATSEGFEENTYFLGFVGSLGREEKGEVGNDIEDDEVIDEGEGGGGEGEGEGEGGEGGEKGGEADEEEEKGGGE